MRRFKYELGNGEVITFRTNMTTDEDKTLPHFEDQVQFKSFFEECGFELIIKKIVKPFLREEKNNGKDFAESGHFYEKGHNCDECGYDIGDHVKYDGITRCVACWIEFDFYV